MATILSWMTTAALAGVSTCGVVANSSRYSFSPDDYAPGDVLRRDVAVIGGGSSGTFAAIALGLKKRTVAVVEKAASFGGHAETYYDPDTNVTVDYGLQEFYNTTIVHDIFGFFNMTLAPADPPNGSTTLHYADFRTGAALDIRPGTDLTAYIDQVRKHPYLDRGWELVPEPIPADLLLPFGEFVEKCNLQDVAYHVAFHAQGLNDVLSRPTAYVLKAYDQVFGHVTNNRSVTPARHDTRQFFELAQARLGEDALPSSVVVATQRPNDLGGVSVVVQTPLTRKLIVASKLLISIPPLIHNLAPFDLDEFETSLFAQWDWSAYYTMLVRNTGLCTGGSYANAATDMPHGIPELPAAYQVTETAVKGLYYVLYGSAYTLDEATVKANVTTVLQRLVGGEGGHGAQSSAPEFVAFASHTPFRPVVSAAAMQDGFYKNLTTLRGRRNTYYGGLALTGTGSTGMWNFTAYLATDIAKAT